MFTGTEEMIGYRQDSPGAQFAWFPGRKLIVTQVLSVGVAAPSFLLNDAAREQDALARIANHTCLVTQPWSETAITYHNRPQPGPELARIGRVAENQIVDCPLNVSWEAKGELSLVIDPSSCDGVDFYAREGGKPAELIVEFEASQGREKP